MDLPLIYQAPGVPKPDEGILPDYEVKTTVQTISKNTDTQLEFILKNLIKSGNK
jgi:hypothetical protein